MAIKRTGMMTPAPKKTSTVPQKAAAGLLEERPAWLKDTDRGSENVTTEDLVIPRLEVVQGLSPVINDDKPEFIEGAKVGDIFNNVTREIYDQPVLFVPVVYRKDYLVWKDRTKGGGFRGSYPDMPTAQAAMDALDDADDCTIIDTPQQFGLIIKPNGTTEQIVISMPRTKAKVSRRFNSIIRMHGGDRFGRAYKFTTVQDKNPKGEFKNLAVADAGYVNETVYRAAEQLYEDVRKGRVQASQKFEEDTEDLDLD